MYILYLKLPKDLVIIVQLEDVFKKFFGFYRKLEELCVVNLCETI